MAWDRQTRGLSQRKQEKPQIKQNTPLSKDGNSGDFSIRNVSAGVFMFFKALGTWFKIFNDKNHLIPDKPNTYDIGSPDKPFRSAFFSDNSIYIGNQKANRIKLGIVGTGDNVKLQMKTPSGKVVADENESLQTVDGDIDLSDTSITSYAIDTSVIEDGNTLTVGSGVDFAVSPLDPSVEEEQRINSRLRFDVEVRNYLRFIDNKFTWFKNEFATMPLYKHNATVDLLNARNTVSASEINTQLEALTAKVNTKLEDINSTFSTVLSNINTLADNIDAVAEQSSDRSEIPDSYDDISNIIFTEVVLGIEDTTPSVTAWQSSQSHTGVTQTSTSGGGTGFTCSISTDGSGNPTFTSTSVGSGYSPGDTLVFTDPGSTSNTATITLVDEANSDVAPVEETKVISDVDKDDYKGSTLNMMQGYWTFASSTNTWTFNNLYGGGTKAHGLSISSMILFINSAPSPSEFDRFTNYFVAEEGFTTTAVKLKSSPAFHPVDGSEVIIGGASDSTAGSVLWKTVDKTLLPNGTPPGYLPSPDKNYTSHRGLAGLELVSGEDYTNVDFLHDNVGGVCTIGGEVSTHTTQYLCEKAGGTWHQ